MSKQVLSIDRLAEFVGVGSLSCSSDGKYLAYVKTSVSLSDDDYIDSIVIYDVASAKVVTEFPGGEPRWSPTRHDLAYLSGHDGATWQWVYSLDTAKARPVVEIAESHYFMGHMAVKNFAWSPDGGSIAYAHAVSDDAAVSNGQIVIDRLLYKTKGGRGRPLVADAMLTHIWVVDVNNGQAQALTEGKYNEHSLSWSPDGRRIAFVSNRSADFDNNQQYDLWTVDVRERSVSPCVQGFGTVFQPAWSPDGRSIAFLAITDKVSTNDSPAADTQLYVVDAKGGAPRCLTTSLDRRIEQPQWRAGGKTICFTAGDHGTTGVYAVDVADARIEKLAGENCLIQEFAFAGDDMYYVQSANAQPPEICRQRAGGEAAQLTSLNAVAAEFDLPSAETIWFKSFDGLDVQGWVIPPVRLDAAKKYPAALVIHGGPHNMFGYAWEERMQILAAAGYGVLFFNPRGSSGYGQDFSRGNVLNWGGGDYKDLMAGVDAAIAQFSWIDSERLVVTGQSYGGYMTNWIVTQTDRFRAAVADGGISNLVSFAGTSLYHSLMESEFNGSAYDNFSLLWQWSPLRNIRSVRTPMLFLHGQVDQEVPLTQAEEMYIGLKKVGVETQFVQYVGEGHGWRPDLKPSNRYDLLQRIVSWFEKCLNQKHNAHGNR